MLLGPPPGHPALCRFGVAVGPLAVAAVGDGGEDLGGNGRLGGGVGAGPGRDGRPGHPLGAQAPAKAGADEERGGGGVSFLGGGLAGVRSQRGVGVRTRACRTAFLEQGLSSNPNHRRGLAVWVRQLVVYFRQLVARQLDGLASRANRHARFPGSWWICRAGGRIPWPVGEFGVGGPSRVGVDIYICIYICIYWCHGVGGSGLRADVYISIPRSGQCAWP